MYHCWIIMLIVVLHAVSLHTYAASSVNVGTYNFPHFLRCKTLGLGGSGVIL
jgi:hypothetical protein